MEISNTLLLQIGTLINLNCLQQFNPITDGTSTSNVNFQLSVFKKILLDPQPISKIRTFDPSTFVVFLVVHEFLQLSELSLLVHQVNLQLGEVLNVHWTAGASLQVLGILGAELSQVTGRILQLEQQTKKTPKYTADGSTSSPTIPNPYNLGHNSVFIFMFIVMA